MELTAISTTIKITARQQNNVYALCPEFRVLPAAGVASVVGAGAPPLLDSIVLMYASIVSAIPFA
jgi:hypothetical protein